MLTVHKVLNNNVVLCTDDAGEEYVAIGRGIAFLVPVGGAVDQDKVHRLFVSTDRDRADRLAKRIASLPIAHVDIAIAVAEEAGSRFGEQIVDRLIVPLADHLDGAIDRVRAGISIDYPLRWEAAAFYPDEVRFARESLATVRRLGGVELPEVEAVPIGLHIVNAELGAESVAATMDITDIIGRCVTIIEADLGVSVIGDDHGIARFASHLLHLLARKRAAAGSSDALGAFLAPLAGEHPREHRAATRMAELIGGRLRSPLSREETLLLTLHVVRLTTSASAPVSPETGRA
jgi:beta-glucoside operon transcriptional antiterminator